MRKGSYGTKGRIGVITPQANPTVEPEIRCLLPAGVSMLTTRCTSHGEARERFLDYFNQLDRALATFDTLRLNAVGFACTASSYLLESGLEKQALHSLQDRFGYPVITAAGAIHEALTFLKARRIAIACPYPQWLFELAVSWWEARGFEVVAAQSVQPAMGDTRAIYEVDAEDAGRAITEAFGGVEADAFVITGTGMPGLQLAIDLQRAFKKPAMNSNLCLAWQCLRAGGISAAERAPTGEFPLLAGWEKSLALL